ncbi:Dps family protein [Bradyrhizobium liaoningense]|uniref:Dps family protein n=1 Tax=Bradyrhizobium liaoningense TaxID=43992 RepID=UPI001BA7E4AD|nr:DNA starvation/stationary phase protection protein [Bradyrhizobium liaoningense]MBR0816618.1 DNA starvation/stationary phase protection protein [Bradyrhizobium liaoningense]
MSTALERRNSAAVVASWSDLGPGAVHEISAALTILLADVFTLYLKTKNFHWHMSGRHFRDYHLLLDEQANQVFAMTDAIAERVRKIGGRTIQSIGDLARRQRLKDTDSSDMTAGAMLAELRAGNFQLLGLMREVHSLCDQREDVASASVLENWIDETEQRIWFLHEATRD